MPEDEDHRLLVLVVEDDELLRSAYLRMLARYGFRALGVESGLAALTVLAERQVDVVLADHRLPKGMTGLQLLDQVRALYPHVGRILITAYLDANLRLRAIDHRVLPKAISWGVLRTIIQSEARRAQGPQS